MSDAKRHIRWRTMAVSLAVPGLVLVAAALSCVNDSSDTVICESGLHCPPGWMCVMGGDTTGETCIPAECGDGLVERANGEVCDDGNLISGDGCSQDCLSNEVCGNRIRDPGEACDDGNTESDDGCRGDCLLLESCGDGKLDPGEVCDDGNTISGDGCSEDCLTLEMCGDGRVDPMEQCDEDEETATCDVDCTRPECGDGHHNPMFADPVTGIMEQCDDGVNSSNCDADCTWAACGDGYINDQLMLEPDDGGEPYAEQCDDGNNDDSDACLSNCQRAGCGDGFLWFGIETCDDGNDDANDGCPSGPTGTCRYARCGDGLECKDAETCTVEACDEAGDTATCDSDCTSVECGDGYANAAAGENCDDGNKITTDDCPDGPDGTCQSARCGDTYRRLGVEECDEGEDNTPTCDSDCTKPVCGDGHVNESFTDPATGITEQCDGGGDTATCDSDCTDRACGDGYVNTTAGEACDEGVVVDTSTCDFDCTIPTCGDGHVNEAKGETCDPGDVEDPDKHCTDPLKPTCDGCECK